MKELKFRTPHYNIDTGKFSHFTYWGRIDYKNNSVPAPTFTSPATDNFCTCKEDEQYTGLKDKHGKEIYEGDIVEVIALRNDLGQKGATETMYIRYFMGNACLCFEAQETGTPIYPLNVDHTIEIIGNIHE